MKRSSIAPPSDDELAAAEVIDLQKRRDRIDQIEQEQEQSRLARAGDPDALEALRASASVLSTQPMGGEGDETNAAVPSTTAKPRKKTAKARPVETRTRPEKVRPAPKQEEEHEEPETREQIDEKRAFKLMDVAYQKWAKAAKTNMSRANRELALDLGRDTALYLRTQIIRLGDLHDVINKLTTGKGGKDDPEEKESFDEEMESMRKALRGEEPHGD